jgi:hypothetical protein
MYDLALYYQIIARIAMPHPGPFFDIVEDTKMYNLVHAVTAVLNAANRLDQNACIEALSDQLQQYDEQEGADDANYAVPLFFTAQPSIIPVLATQTTPPEIIGVIFVERQPPLRDTAFEDKKFHAVMGACWIGTYDNMDQAIANISVAYYG